jgi:hypothetical protein
VWVQVRVSPSSEKLSNEINIIGGRGGIRTHGTLAGTPVFKTGALNHSATLPTVENAEFFDPPAEQT